MIEKSKQLCLPALLAVLVLVLPSVGFAQRYTQTNLDSDLNAIAPNSADAQLLNPWGMARTNTSPWWISDNGAGVTTLFNGTTGAKQGLVVTIPGINGEPSSPTGQVAAGTDTDFTISAGVPAKFIFVTEDGTIAAWNSGATATTMVSKPGKAVYKGVTIAELNGKRYLYAANFLSGEVEVYDGSFKPVNLGRHAFALDGDNDGHGPFGFDFFDRDDRDDRGGRAHYGPFNVQAIGGSIVVAFAKQSGGVDEVDGPGLGFVCIYDPAGRLQSCLQHGNWFNAPWGIALAPGEFGEFSHDLLIGNFGSGQIAAFNPFNGHFAGLMIDSTTNKTLTIDGLWGIGFGNDGSAGPYNTLFFTAGPNDEMDGLFGKLVPVSAELTEIDEP